MKAIHQTAIGGPEVLKLVDVPEPEPAPGTLRLRNRASATNFHDSNARRGQEEDLSLPRIPGSDFAGEVDAVGEGVTGFSVGDRVLGLTTDGAYAEKTLALAALAIPIPDDVSFEQAAACPVAGLTAWFLLQDLGVTRETTLVTHAAAGSVGCFLGGLARELGATSIGLVSSAAKAEVARRAGHTHLVNYREADPVAKVKELTEGRGADVVYDSVAGPRFGQSIEMTASGGTVVLFGHAAGDPDPQTILQDFLRSGRNLGLRTYFLGTSLQTQFPKIAEAYAQLFTGLREERIHLPIETLPLEQAAQAHARIEGQKTVGKVILVP